MRYDGENWLVSATAAGVTTTLTYDPLGRLWQVVKGSANTRFLTDGDAIVAEYDGSGNLTNRYVHGSNAAADDPLVWYVGSGLTTKRYLQASTPQSGQQLQNPLFHNAAAPPSLTDWLKSIFDPNAITYGGRTLNVSDLGFTKGGVVSVNGWIGRNDRYLNIVIYDIRAQGFSSRGIVRQGLEAAYATTRRLGLEGITIQGSLANPRLAAYLPSIVAGYGGRIYSAGSWETVVIPVPVDVPIPAPQR